MAAYEIRSPNRAYAGETGGVRFTAGRAKVSDPSAALLAYFRRRGYKVVELDPDGQPSDQPAPPIPGAGGIGTPVDPSSPPITATDDDGGDIPGGDDTPGGDLYDPAKHNADDVIQHLAASGADDAEIRRVLDAERAGRNRAGLTRQLAGLVDTDGDLQ